MADKGSISVTFVRGDRELWSGGGITLSLWDPFSNSEKKIKEVTTEPHTNTVIFRGVSTERGQNYSLIANARGFRDAAVYPVKPITGAVISKSLMLIRNDPEPDFSSFSFASLKEQSLAFANAFSEGGITETAFLKLGPERIAGALNIEAKLRNTSLNGTPAVEFVKRIDGLKGIQQHRILSHVDASMPKHVRAEMEQSQSFFEVPAFANEVFHRGFPVSFKQEVSFGSLQLSFAEKADDDGLLAADIDIDLFTDIGHFGEVLRNLITEKETDPYTVYVELFDQGITPLYVLEA